MCPRKEVPSWSWVMNDEIYARTYASPTKTTTERRKRKIKARKPIANIFTLHANGKITKGTVIKASFMEIH